MRYHAHRLLVDPARAGAHSIPRLVIGFLIVVILTVFLSLLILQSADSLAASFGLDSSGISIVEGHGPFSMLALLFSFISMTIAVWATLWLLHQREIGPLFGPVILLRPQFFKVIKALVVLNIALFLLPPWSLPLPGDAALKPNLALGTWALLLPLSLLAVLVQVSAEEIVFRGYLQQQLAARFSHPAVWIMIPSVIFGLLHHAPEAGSNAWLITIWAVIFGMLMADLTARAGSLGPAIAVHFVNNVVAMLLISVPDSLGGLALYHYPAGLDDEAMVRALLPIDFGLMLISWLTARLAIRR